MADRMWPRGVSKEKAEIDLWLKELAANDEAVEALRTCVKKGKVTLVYAAEDEAHNNAVALAEYLARK